MILDTLNLALAEATSLIALNTTLTADNSSLLEEVNELLGDMVELNQTIDTLDLDNDALTATVAALEARIAELEAEEPAPANPLPLPSFSVTDAGTVNENGPAVVNFTVSLSGAYDQIIDVDYSTFAGTATAGQDFVATSGGLRFFPGELTKNVPVTLINDALVEGNETFTLQLSNARVLVNMAKPSGLATIVSEDVTPPPPPPPVPGEMPTDANTGVRAGVTLVASSKTSYSTAGEVVKGKILTGDIVVTAANVTFEDCEFRGSPARNIWFKPGSNGGKVLYCTVRGGNKGIVGESDDLLFDHNNIKQCIDGIEFFGSRNEVRYNYVVDFRAPSGAHNDGISGEGHDLWIHHNYVHNNATQTSAIMVSLTYSSSLRNPRVEYNIAKGAGYTIYWVDNIIDGVFNYNEVYAGYYGTEYVNAPYKQKIGNKYFNKAGQPI